MRLCIDSLISSEVDENPVDSFNTAFRKYRIRHGDGIAEYITDKLAFY